MRRKPNDNGIRMLADTVNSVLSGCRRCLARREDGEYGEATSASNETDYEARLTRAALAYLKAHDLLASAARFDVVEMIWPEDERRPEIHHLVDALPAVGHRQFYNGGLALRSQRPDLLRRLPA